jgi:hypothetical protein
VDGWGATGLEPSEREERRQGDYSSNGADDEGVHYQLVHGSFPSWTKEQSSGITAGWRVGPFSKALSEHRLEPMLKFLNGFAHIAQPDKAK